MDDLQTERQILSISQLNRRARSLLETHLSLLWVRGEVSNLARPGSGHWYFTLKDNQAQIRCAMFRNRNRLLGRPPRDGDQVVVRGRVGLYEARGEYQLIVEHLEADGAGLLQQQFEALKAKLEAEGLFDPAGKRALPSFPARIGVITSPTGAAIRDILHVTARRCPWVEIDIYPTPVQGEEAPRKLIEALELANARGDCDLLILSRGGGSLEDLWAFNDEALARAIRGSRLPVVSAVGHETDFTIADFVADQRAPTPSAAAEIATPDGEALARNVNRSGALLLRALHGLLERERERLNALGKRLRSPRDRLREHTQHLDHLEIRLVRAWRAQENARRSRLEDLTRRFHALHPGRQLGEHRETVASLRQRLTSAMQRRTEANRQRLQGLAATLNAVSPLATLERGYAIASDSEGQILRTVEAVASGDPLQVRLHDGRLDCRVEDRHKEENVGGSANSSDG